VQTEAGPRCKYCGFETHGDVIKAALWTHNGLVVVEDIPARVCQGCGEQFFDEEVTQKIENVPASPAAKAKRRVRIPVYSISRNRAGERHRTKADQKDEEILLCKYCGCETVQELVRSAFWVDGQLFAVENVAAQVCRRCKQQFYDAEISEKLTTLANEAPGQAGTRQMSVPVFSLADVESSDQ
jgi:YgiT-type zinc finger domain-containing protein